MTKYIVYNDLHIMAPHDLGIRPEPHVEQDKDGIVVLNGDIVDLQNCKKKDIPKAIMLIRRYRLLYQKHYILGNHALQARPCQGYYKHNGILFRHGDHEFWGKKKRDAYMRNATPGAGWFKRNVLVRSFSWLRRIWTARYSKAFKERCVESCFAHSCHTIVLGHKHNRKIKDFKYKDIRIIVLPRGRNILQL